MKTFILTIRSSVILLVFLMACQHNKQESSKVTNLPKAQILQVIEEDNLGFSWENPTDTSFLVIGYRIFYRVHDTENWIPINKVIHLSDSPSTCISRDDINSSDSLFDFAVCAYFQNGDSSQLNISTDTYSLPKGGWFVKWSKSPL